jgi:hypothetical protein
MIIAINFMLGGELVSFRASRRWIDSNDMQVIVIIRLHAMYQGSRKMLVFLSGIFLTLQIPSVIMAVVQDTGASGSKLLLCISDFCASGLRDKY